MFIEGADSTPRETVMNDPHVASLTYRTVKPEYVTYNNPPPVTGELPAFRYRLENGSLLAKMKEHHATVETARECVEEFLRAWELDAALNADKNEFSFAFQGSNVIDRNPPPEASRGKSAAAMDMLVFSDEAKVEKVKSAYPPPPSGLKPSLDTETMWHHYSRYLEDREKLTSMGFYCLSLLQWRTGTKTARQDVAAQYDIDLDVLKTLGTLTSDIGDLTSARKLEMSSHVRPHTPKEVEWVKAVVKMLIRRKAEYDNDPTATRVQITMKDFPQL
jgi:hypothetical protein